MVNSKIEMTKFVLIKRKLESFNPETKAKFDFIFKLATKYSRSSMVELLNQYNLRRHFALPKYKKYKDFAYDELFKAGEELTRINFNCNWHELDYELTKILEDIEKTKDIASWTTEHIEERKILLLSIIVSSGLFNEKSYIQ